jgi:sulfopyruvate decarboxylase subunit beta
MTNRRETTKTDAIRAVIGAATDVPVVFTTGYTSRIAHGIGDRPNHLYMTGSMGLCAPIALGIALATRRPAVAVDGDGSLLMNPAALVAAGSLAPLPLVHVLLDDGAYDSTGGQQTGSGRVDLARWALAAGYRTARTAASAGALADLVAWCLAGEDGPILLHCRVARLSSAPPGRLGTDLSAHAGRFTARLCAPTAC